MTTAPTRPGDRQAAPSSEFTAPAVPYAGGDPYADYRAPAGGFPFQHLPDLADAGLGGTVVAASDEFFAERERLLRPGRAEFDPDLFGPKGKSMDGWETRRRRGGSATAPHPEPGEGDTALIRLGTPGVVRGVVVDTAHFRGNNPQSVSVEGARLPGTPGPEELGDPGTVWTTLVPRTPVTGHAANGFAVSSPRRFTHLRLTQYPDGGVARLRVHGVVLPEPAWLTALGTFDVLAQEHGGRVLDASDRFFSSPANTLRPGRPSGMADCWETRRRRDEGHDWIDYALAGEARVRAIELDTGELRGNAAGWVALHGADSPAESGSCEWRPLLPRTPLQPDTVHRFLLPEPVGPLVRVRLDIFPDGGVGRLRLHGSLTEHGAAELAARHREAAG
ncbi:allantoicase [Streptomyces xiaopingdaonensis]|uniref:allantoicase n=1 Tax=Streptomyces xiaopingdaonensis TaxID=1565415 RepID=UPI00030DB212|nr:allantoicase [Streptomyces xiaopingdaonensis]